MISTLLDRKFGIWLVLDRVSERRHLAIKLARFVLGINPAEDGFLFTLKSVSLRSAMICPTYHGLESSEMCLSVGVELNIERP
jgi:hypothetical protein